MIRTQWLLIISTCLFFNTHGWASVRDEIELALEANNLDHAIILIEEHLEQYPENTEIRIQKARIKGWQGNYAEAQRTLETILNDDDTNVDAQVDLARVLAWQQKYTDAAALYRKVISLHPDYLDAYIGLARVYYWQNQYQHALSILDTWRAEHPTVPEVETLESEIRAAQKTVPSDKKQLQPTSRPRVFETGHTWDHLTGVHKSERFHYYGLKIPINEQWEWLLRAEEMNRFGKSDFRLEPGLIWRPNDCMTWTFMAGWVERANFSARDRQELGLALKIRENTVLDSGVGRHNFAQSPNVMTSRLGFDQYFGRYWNAGYRWYLSEQANHYINTHLLRITYHKEQDLLMSLTYAWGGEGDWVSSLEEVTDAYTQSISCLIKKHICEWWGVFLSGHYVSRSGGYDRQGVTVGSFWQF